MKKTITLLLLFNIAVFAQQKGSFVDSRDSQNYKTTKIGKQTWMAENLNYNASGSKCYENKSQNCSKYGRLYDWNTARKNACPSGWHLPTDEEWEELYIYVDSANGLEIVRTQTRAKKGYKPYIFRGWESMRTTDGWDDYERKSGNGTDKFGFSALPSGRFSGKDFQFVGRHGYWWSASKEAGPHYRSMSHDGGRTYTGNDDGNLYSIRCLRNGNVPAGFEKMVKAESITDSRDGQKYKAVKIGSQTWMAENLNYNASYSVCYSCDFPERIDSRCYDHNPQNCKKYGRLYDWEMAINACPSGWHLPANEEWDQLYRYADGSSGKEGPYHSNTAGAFLKMVEGWEAPGGTDKYGFSALPGGYSVYKGRFAAVGFSGVWWSSSEDSSTYDRFTSTYRKAYYRHIHYDIKEASYSIDYKDGSWRSVRCIKN
jgi:uncharacterized protein (TIGR02145 family)